MAVEKPDKDDDREARTRIDELESQVNELSGLVEILLTGREDELTRKLEAESARDEAENTDVPEKHAHHLVDDVKESLGRALGGEEGESLESRIGGIWLGRVVAILFMTLLVLGGLMTVQDETIDPLMKIAIGYLVSAGAVLYGILRRKSENFFPQTILGAGLAAFYFTTYAGFFLENTRVFTTVSLGIPCLAAALVVVGLVAHLRRSATVAGISLFLIYYTVVLSLSTSMDDESVIYALITGSLLAFLALVFHFTHRWLLFTWGALVATQLTYIYFFVLNPPQLGFSEQTYFWYSNAFLTLVFCVFATASITDAHRTGEFRKTVAPMAGVNSFVYLVLTWMAIRMNYAEYEWAFRLGQTSMFLVFTVYAFLAGPHRNYLFQIFAAKSFVIFTLAMQAYLSHEWLLVALSLECLALGFSYMRSGLVIFKLLGLGLLAVVTTSCLFSIRLTHQIDIFGYTVQARWFSCVAVPLVLSVVAWFYEHFIRRLPAESREVKSQWFLADTWIDLSGGAMAMLHASAGALILMAITIIDLGDQPSMPYILAAEGIGLALLGLLLAAPQVEIASVLLLIAAHVCYHIFLWVGKPGFETQPNYVTYTLVVAVVTYLGGYLWERFLRRVRGGTQFEHDAMASVPYVIATLMLATLMQRQLDPVYAPLAQLVLGAALFLASATTLLIGLRFAGIVAFVLGTASFYTSLYDVHASIAQHPDFAMGLLAILLCHAAAERSCAVWGHRLDLATRVSQGLRTTIVASAALLGALALREWAPREQLSFYWLGHAMGAMILGFVLRESRYRWAGMVLYIGTAVYFLLNDLSNSLRFPIVGVLVIAGLVLTWSYSESRERQLAKLRKESSDPPSGEDTARDNSITDG